MCFTRRHFRRSYLAAWLIIGPITFIVIMKEFEIPFMLPIRVKTKLTKNS